MSHDAASHPQGLPQREMRSSFPPQQQDQQQQDTKRHLPPLLHFDEEKQTAAPKLDDAWPLAPSPPLSHPLRSSTMVKVFRMGALLLVSAVLSSVFYLTTAAPEAGASSQQSAKQPPGGVIDAWTAPADFPKEAFDAYYEFPATTTQNPRPVITDPGRNSVFPDALDRPYPLPTGNPSSEAVYPKKKGPQPPANLVDIIKANLTAVLTNANLDNCTKCIDSLRLGQVLARGAPKEVPQLLTDLCIKYKYLSPREGLPFEEVCKRTYAPAVFGAQYAQILSYANLEGDRPRDALGMCRFVVKPSQCPAPPLLDISKDFLDRWFEGKGREAPVEHERVEARAAPEWIDEKTGKPRMLKVLHVSDIHVDPRYYVGSEAACTSGQCCRSVSFNSTVASGPPSPIGAMLPPANTSQAAPYYGAFRCDAPWSLVMSAFEAMGGPLTNGVKPDMTLFTGDMVTHDAVERIGRDIVLYTQQAICDTMKRYLGHGPVFSALGNHDSAPSDFASPHGVPTDKENFSWDYDNLARLYEAEGWFTHEEAKQVGLHYSGYSVSPRKGLRVIALNTDHWYKNNPWNFINTTDPDVSGNLRFLTDELHAAERRREKVWIVGHVLTGWDGSNALADPTNLFQAIVERYAKTIAFIAMGHTHEDYFNVFYANNGTKRTAAEAVAVSHIGPSITPLTNVNSAMQVYTIDPTTYLIHDIDTYYADVDGFNHQKAGVTWRHLYSARSAYSNFSSSVSAGRYKGGVALEGQTTWPTSAPLNATFWAALTDELEARLDAGDRTPLDDFRRRQGRNSPRTKLCSSLAKSDDCYRAQVCYMRSSSTPIGQGCIQGYNSVQS